MTVNFGTSEILFGTESRKAAGKLVSNVHTFLMREIFLNTRIPQCMSSELSLLLIAIC